MQDGHPIACSSKALATAERNYVQIEKECLAIVFLCTKFDQYIWQNHGYSTYISKASGPDPFHSQTNRKAELTVKIAKKLVKKTELDGSDLWKAILDWNITSTVGSSSTQRLMSRRTKTLVVLNS